MSEPTTEPLPPISVRGMLLAATFIFALLAYLLYTKLSANHVLEVADSIPRTETKGRTDWFDGTSFTLTLEQAEALYLQLGSSLVLAKSLVSSGEAKVKS